MQPIETHGAATLSLPFVILGNPENRRLTLFQAALRSEGFAPARVVPWLELLEDPKALERVDLAQCWFRIDAAGENFEVERALLTLGARKAKAAKVSTVSASAIAALGEDRGRILAPAQAHLGFGVALRRVERLLAKRPGWRQLNPVPEILELFDKRRTSARFAAAGIPVPESLGRIRTVAELDAKMEAQQIPAVFVKLSSGSSASCLGIYRRPGAFHTTIEQADTGWYNTLRIRHVRDRGRIEELLTFLLREGAQVERSIPKARFASAFFDLRVLCVAGEPAFVVVRQNRHPITNLHLGGWRGALDGLKAVIPARAWDSAMDSCRKVAALYRSLHLGIDLMFEPDWARHRILEANAFGDLLPNLSHQGKNVWEWELHTLKHWHRGTQ